MRTWASGVSIVTAHHDGVDHGLTVSSFASVSLDPPQVLAVVAKVRRTLPLLQQSGAFAVCILAADQISISNRFASSDTEFTNRFEGLEVFRAETGAPIIAGSLAWLDCSVVDTWDVGNNIIFLGQVLAGGAREGAPLLYWDRNYRQLKDQ